MVSGEQHVQVFTKSGPNTIGMASSCSCSPLLSLPCLTLFAAFRVLEDHEWQLTDRQQRYGTNEMAIPVKSVASLVADEMWHPFYVFQYFSILIWVAGDAYYTYAICIGIITWFSIITSAVETHQNMKRLADIAQSACKVR